MSAVEKIQRKTSANFICPTNRLENDTPDSSQNSYSLYTFEPRKIITFSAPFPRVIFFFSFQTIVPVRWIELFLFNDWWEKKALFPPKHSLFIAIAGIGKITIPVVQWWKCVSFGFAKIFKRNNESRVFFRRRAKDLFAGFLKDKNKIKRKS